MWLHRLDEKDEMDKMVYMTRREEEESLECESERGDQQQSASFLLAFTRLLPLPPPFVCRLLFEKLFPQCPVKKTQS